MKKFLLITSLTIATATAALAQSSDFDKKVRFGLRVAGQPTWFSSNNNNTTKLNTAFGFGFGLVAEFKLSDIIHFSTGIGGDFEGGSVKYRYDSSPGGYNVRYVMDNSGDLVEAENGTTTSSFHSASNTTYGGVYQRDIKTTYVSIPFTLKMLTNEISGFRYFGMFGGELGVRTKIKAEDKYNYSVGNNTSPNGGTNTDLIVSKDGSAVPLRIGLNVGAGAEYRISGSTSLFLSVNYFRSFTNLMRKESKYMYTAESGGSTLDFTHMKQGLFANAVRINVGVLF